MSTVRRTCFRRRAGFTLIEVLGTIVILSVLGSITSFITLAASDNLLEASTRAQLHAELSSAMDRVVRELRKIPLDTGASGLAPDINSTSLIWVEWNNGGSAESVYFFGGNLTIQKNGGAYIPIMTDVSACTMKTYDESNTLLPSNQSTTGCDPIRRIELTVTAQRYGVSETIRTRVFIRSTMDGAVY